MVLLSFSGSIFTIHAVEEVAAETEETTPTTNDSEWRSDDKEALRKLLKETTAAFNARDITTIQKFFTSSFFLVLSDQEVYRGEEGLKNLMISWFDGPDAPLASLTFEPTVDEETLFLSKTVAISTGISSDTYTLKETEESLVIPSRWTACIHKTDSGWKIASLHTGVNVVNNPMMDSVQAKCKNGIFFAGITSLILGVLLGFRLKRQKKTSEPTA